MDDMVLPGRDDDRNILKELCSRYGVPAYARRARAVQEAHDRLLDRCRAQREEWLTMARTRVGLLRALAGDFAALRPWLDDAGQVAVLERLHALLQPRLRAAVRPTSAPRALLRALREVCDSVERFNRRWTAYLAELDLTALNQLRDDYNRYYVLEKECAVRSPRLARQGFQLLDAVTPEALLEHLPVLPVPVLAR